MPLGPNYGTGQAYQEYSQDEGQAQEPPHPGLNTRASAGNGREAESDEQDCQSNQYNDSNGKQ